MQESQPSTPYKNGESLGVGYFSVPFHKDDRNEWAGAFTLLDTMETYFDARIDLLQRKFQKHSDRLKLRVLKAEETLKIKDMKLRAEEAFKIKDINIKLGDLSTDALTKNLDKEVKEFKLRVTTRMTELSATWHSAKVVKTREKVTFFFGVMSVLFSALIFGLAPQWVHIAYTLQGLYLLPMRAYKYRQKAWHYFLFDLCYYVNILNFIYIWILPGNAALFVACYCLSHGSLASAVITWRNSLVFHDSDKVTSLFIHIYPPFCFSTIRHFYQDAPQRFPALAKLPHLEPIMALSLSGVIYLIWQTLYWKFLLVDRRAKIESGQRTTSFSFLLNDKRGFIGRSLAKIPPQYREASFIGGQLLYGILTEIPAVFVLYDSAFWSATFLIVIFGVSVWNGGGFYIEVFGRKFERELEALRKELAEATARSTPSVGSSDDEISLPPSPSNLPVALPELKKDI